jgi:hypothetical protein
MDANGPAGMTRASAGTSDSGETDLADANGPAALIAAGVVASDSSGMNLVALAGDIWTSTDGGMTWTDRTSSGAAHGQTWKWVASDSTGQKLVAVVDGFVDTPPGPVVQRDIWTSTDGGVSWVDRTASSSASGQAWYGVVSDSTGTNLVAVTPSVGFGAVFSSGAIWTSSNGGVT